MTSLCIASTGPATPPEWRGLSAWSLRRRPLKLSAIDLLTENFRREAIEPKKTAAIVLSGNRIVAGGSGRGAYSAWRGTLEFLGPQGRCSRAIPERTLVHRQGIIRAALHGSVFAPKIGIDLTEE